MKRSVMLVAVVLVLALSVGATAADQWLHIRVEDRGSRPEHVSVNIPLDLVEAILPMVEIDEFRQGRIHLPAEEFEGLDLHELLVALRDAPDADYVRVQSDDETVRVAKEGGYLIVRVDEDRGDRVRIRIPLAVIDAMLQGNEDELDLVAGLRALAQFEGEDLLVVEGDDESVRVWIDSSAEGE
jgi:hypothetical protein